MLPFGDDNSDRQRWPIVTALFVAVNVVVFLYELSLGAAGGSAVQEFVIKWGVIPAEYALGRDMDPQAPGPFWITIITSMFIHGGWGHLFGNMLYLWVFGDNVEDRLGRIKFVIFYLATGAAGALAQILVDPGSTVPTVGASGAISGVLGAYITMFPRKRVRILAFYFIVEVPALVVIGMWALTQFVSGIGSIAYRTSETGGGGVAYLAHVGGFVAGVLGALIWKAIAPPRSGGPAQSPRDRSRYV